MLHHIKLLRYHITIFFVCFHPPSLRSLRSPALRFWRQSRPACVQEVRGVRSREFPFLVHRVGSHGVRLFQMTVIQSLWSETWGWVIAWMLMTAEWQRAYCHSRPGEISMAASAQHGSKKKKKRGGGVCGCWSEELAMNLQAWLNLWPSLPHRIC